MIRLRALELTDIEPVHGLASCMDPLCSREKSEEFLRGSMLGFPTDAWRSFVWAIADCPSGNLVGLCGLVIPRGAEEGEIWFVVHPGWWGKGIATEAARQLIEFGFGELGLNCIWAGCLPENPASSRVLQKAGMRRQGVLERNLTIRGVCKTSLLHQYAILAEEWDRRTSALCWQVAE